VYRGFNVAGSGLQYLKARRARDRNLAGYWRGQVAANFVRKNRG